MDTFEQIQISDVANVARVRAVEHDGCRLYLEFPNGYITTVDNEEPFEFGTGSIVLVWPNEQYIEAAPDDLWPDESWVGVIRLILPDITVVGSNGRWIGCKTQKMVNS